MTTTVYVTQAVAPTLNAGSSVSPGLNSDYWSDPSAPVGLPVGQQVEALWMDRDIGITDGDTWIFTTTVDVGGTPVQLQEQVTGTAFSSTIAIQIQADGQSTGWQENEALLKFSANGTTYQAAGSFYLPSGADYDNVAYTIEAV